MKLQHFKKFNQIIIHDCRGKWDLDGKIIWYHQHANHWYLYDDSFPCDTIISHCPFCGAKLSKIIIMGEDGKWLNVHDGMSYLS